MLQGKSKVFVHGKAKTLYISFHSEMATDSQFPIKKGDVVDVTVEGEEIRIRKSKK